MLFDYLESNLKFDLKNTAKDTIEKDIVYKDVFSPFSRIFYIEKGTGFIFYNNNMVDLEPGQMYLVPSYVFCTYSFNKGLSLYYVHFVNSLEYGFNLYDLFHCSAKVKATQIDTAILQELLEIHPNIQLTSTNPEIYQKKSWILNPPTYDNFGDYLLTSSIIGQLLSRFICSVKTTTLSNNAQRKLIKPILIYIFENLNQEIPITVLAKKAALSKDHFTRIFKNLLGMPPNEFICKKRIEKAQALLVSTGLSQKEIIEMVGFNSLSYFSRMFVKHTGLTPGEFRKKVGNILIKNSQNNT